MSEFSVGSLVRARGREWVVLPGSDADLLLVRPLGGADDEAAGILREIEAVDPAHFALPDPADCGDHRSCRLLYDALRLGFRSSAGPFRSFARIAVSPRPYQLVPLLMALKLDPVRLLIADDVGIGKTIEACLIARELLDRGEISRTAVLSPPHLVEQWANELSEKFHIESELVLPSTAARLERPCGHNESLFDRYPHVIVSLDFIKSEHRRIDFLRACPEFVIVDEAHTCSFAAQGGRGRHQRYELIRDLARNQVRHLVLVTATPHSGKEEAFRSLLAILRPEFAELPSELTGPENEPNRRRIGAHFVQRRRGDIRQYLGAETAFPSRPDEPPESYQLTPEYERLLQKAISLAQDTVSEATGNRFQQRIHWWSALALLRSIGSSPAAAIDTLRTRSSASETVDVEEADEIGARAVFDPIEDENAEGTDVAPGSQLDDVEDRKRRRFLDLAREIEALETGKDNKVAKAIQIVKELVRDDYQPIVFCRFIPTAEYVAERLRSALHGVEVAAVTGVLPPEEREARIAELAKSPKRVLVCTDCLSEGMNLQQEFNAVVHYDLSWNPTRHEQREGRVDRFGQPRPTVRVVTLYGKDNPIDGIVLDVLIQKHKKIRSSLGVSVPVPVETEDVLESIFAGMLLRENRGGSAQPYLEGFEEYFRPERKRIHDAWDAAEERERRSRTIFAQESIKANEIAAELQAARTSAGDGADVERFVLDALLMHRAVVSDARPFDIKLTEAPRSLRDLVGVEHRLRAQFDLPAADGVTYLSRTHPFVGGLAAYVIDTALDPQAAGVAKRCGSIRTRSVTRRTALFLLRLRFHLIVRRGSTDHPLLVEDAALAAFEGSPNAPVWLPSDSAEALLSASPDANVTPGEAQHFLRQVLDAREHWAPALDDFARDRGRVALQAHQRVRIAARQQGVRYRVEPHLPPDVLGLFLLLPMV